MAAVDVMEDRKPPWDGQEIDVREEHDEDLHARVEPPLVEVAEGARVLTVLVERHTHLTHVGLVPSGRVEAHIHRPP